jgi:hypothetical protein
MLHLESDGVLADVAASLIYSTYTGNAGGASLSGSCAYFVEDGVASGESYAVGISSTNNNGLSIITGAVGCKNLVLSGIQGQTDNMLYIDGSTGTGWVGDADVAMLQLKTDGTLANAAASMCILDFDGTYASNGLGGCLYVDDDGTADGVNYSVYVNSNAVNAMLLRTVAVGATGLVIDGPASQTASMLKVNGATGSWIGADGVGMVQLDNDGAFAHVNSSMLLLTNTGIPQDDSRGHCLRIVDTGNAAAGTAGYAVYISATDATVEALYVDAGKVLVDETVQAIGGILTAYSILDVGDPPTQDNMDNAFGAGSAALNGMLGVINDADGGANAWLCFCAHGQWYYLAKATVGA